MTFRAPPCIIKIFIVLTHNFSKEHYVLPEDDLKVETCRSVLSVLV